MDVLSFQLDEIAQLPLSTKLEFFQMFLLCTTDNPFSLITN